MLTGLLPGVQFTEAKILSEFIKTDAHRMEVQARPPMAVTNAVSWRSEGIKYKKNEARPIMPATSCVPRISYAGRSFSRPLPSWLAFRDTLSC